ncbi:anti-sigma factor family protein [Alicyclobacillus dauci]|uniref:Anti-sigma-W factor RsiW n=1 Tax=Alicyclobacillus dauci TaxID=1475485 RepID=A0ABY6YZL6_9BACL|nr:zf-HC2 domain-containing protein [Alicyclobacillus dauci]WAH35904.1 zf-HC2 domain-containing protein [Alicyclobacillus dauci]
MTCFDVENAMTDYVLGGLDEDRAALVTEHIQRCPSCCAWYQDVLASSKFLEQETFDPVIDITANVMSRIAEIDSPKTIIIPVTKHSTQRRWRQMMVAHYAIAASLTLMVFGLDGFQRMDARVLTWTGMLSHGLQGLMAWATHM